MLNNFWPCIWPQGKKRKEKKKYHRILGSQFATLGANLRAYYLISWCQCRTFISNLGGGGKPQAQNAQSWPQVFAALTPRAKWAY